MELSGHCPSLQNCWHSHGVLGPSWGAGQEPRVPIAILTLDRLLRARCPGPWRPPGHSPLGTRCPRSDCTNTTPPPSHPLYSGRRDGHLGLASCLHPRSPISSTLAPKSLHSGEQARAAGSGPRMGWAWSGWGGTVGSHGRAPLEGSRSPIQLSPPLWGPQGPPPAKPRCIVPPRARPPARRASDASLATSPATSAAPHPGRHPGAPC